MCHLSAWLSVLPLTTHQEGIMQMHLLGYIYNFKKLELPSIYIVLSLLHVAATKSIIVIATLAAS